MKINFKFLDKLEWSAFGTLNTIIPFFLLLITRRKITLENMIFQAIISMMEGDLLPKILFIGFLNFMVMKNNINWFLESFIYLISVVIFHFIPYDNFIHKFFYKNNIGINILRISIIIYMTVIFNFIFNKSKNIIKFLDY